MGRRAQANILRQARNRAFKAQGGRCFWCNYRMYRRDEREYHSMPNQAVTAEHLFPVSEGGPDEWWNIVAACFSCNTKRGHMPIVQWVFYLRRNIGINGGEAQFAVLLSKLATFGIEIAAGQPAKAALATVPTADCPPPKEPASAP